MVKKESYTIEPFYEGNYSSFNPEKSSYGNVLGHIPINQIGSPTSIQTANQLKEVHDRISEGTVPIELQPLQEGVFDQIPKQHFKEINRLAKLTGAKLSLHAPFIEPSGLTKDGWSETNRELAERQLKDVIDRAAELSDKEPVPMVVHSSAIPGSEYSIVEEGGKRVKKMDKLIVINQETGKIAPLEEERRYYPHFENLDKGKIYSPKKELEVLNDSEWDNSVSNVIFYKDNADKILTDREIRLVSNKIVPLIHAKGENLSASDLTPTEQEVYSRYMTAQEYLKHSEMVANGLFNKAYKYGDDKTKEKLKEVAEEYQKFVKSENVFDVLNKSKAVDILIQGVTDANPNLYKPIEDFALENSSKTFGNVAFDTYKKYHDKENIPIINIENLYPGMAFSSSEDMEKLILESRRQFVEKAKKEGIQEAQAKKAAEKMIGMTLDVGHLNIARKKGFEDKDLMKEVEAISKYVKHVHLTDNFGYSDSHLPPGMGNVPTKEILEELKKQGYEGRKIVEAGGFVQHFKQSPFPATIEALGSPIYSMEMAPYWNQKAGLYQDYFGGYGMMLPQGNYNTFGAGFAQLPAELGGKIAGAEGSRMSGRPME